VAEKIIEQEIRCNNCGHKYKYRFRLIIDKVTKEGNGIKVNRDGFLKEMRCHI